MWREIFVTIARLLTASPAEWKELRKAEQDPHSFLSRFLHPIFGIIVIVAYVGGMWIASDGNIENALKKSIIAVVGVYGGYLISSYFLNEMAPRFGVKRDLFLFRKFVGYASIVIYLLIILTSLLPRLFILWVFVFYTIYLVNAGAIYFLNVTKDKQVEFTVVASAAIIFVPFLICVIFSYLIR